MKHIVLTIVLIAPILCQAQGMETLTAHMTGSFTSAEQAKADTNYFDIELEMLRIWPEREDGVWLYVEQAVATKKEKPYRQRVYHVEQVNDSTFTSSILKIAGGAKYYGGYANAELLKTLTPDSLEALEGCAISLHPKGDTFVGSTDGNSCKNAWGKASYATSEVTIASNKMISWDRGWNDEGEHVWGAENGGYIFVKSLP